jgi:hypothetical protein
MSKGRYKIKEEDEIFNTPRFCGGNFLLCWRKRRIIMAVNVDKTYKTDNITLSCISSSSAFLWELAKGKERIYFTQETFEELKAIMAEVLHKGEDK